MDFHVDKIIIRIKPWMTASHWLLPYGYIPHVKKEISIFILGKKKYKGKKDAFWQIKCRKFKLFLLNFFFFLFTICSLETGKNSRRIVAAAKPKRISNYSSITFVMAREREREGEREREKGHSNKYSLWHAHSNTVRLSVVFCF